MPDLLKDVLTHVKKIGQCTKTGILSHLKRGWVKESLCDK